MRTPCLLLCLLFSSALYLCQTTAPSPATPDSGLPFATVSGSVVRLDTGQPLKKAVITLENRSAAANSAYDVTDERGHFSVQKVVPGSYRLVVSRNGFVDAEYGQKRVGGSGAVLTLSAGQRMTELVFKLACTAALSGHVYDEDGEPVRGHRLSGCLGAREARADRQPADRTQRFRRVQSARPSAGPLPRFCFLSCSKMNGAAPRIFEHPT